MKSPRLKLGRAEAHLRELDAAVRGYLVDAHRVTSEFDTHDWNTVLVEVVKPFPDHLGLLAGDAAHNMRSALDHIVYAVSRGRAKRGSFFPIATREVDYLGPREEDRRPMRDEGLGGVPAALLAVFDSAQPYLSGDDAEIHPFACIARLDNADKHRTIQLGLVVVKEPNSITITTQHTPEGAEGSYAEIEWLAINRPLALGKETEVCRWRINPPQPEGAEVDVKLRPYLVVSFGQRATTADLFLAWTRVSELIDTIETKIG